MSYKRPLPVLVFRWLAIISFVLGAAMIIAAIVTRKPETVGGGVGGFSLAFCLWLSSEIIDYLARTAHHSERAADSLARIEWEHRQAAARAKASVNQ